MQLGKRRFISFVRKYGRAIVFSGLLFILGLFLGSVYSVIVGQDSMGEIGENVFFDTGSFNIENIDKAESFWTAVRNDIIPLIFIWLSGFSPFLIPLVFVGIIGKGFNLGFSVGVLVRLFGGKGFVFAIGSTLLQNIVFVPIFILLGVYSVQNSLKYRKMRKSRDEGGRKRIFREQLLVFIGILLSVILSGGIEGFIVPHILELI